MNARSVAYDILLEFEDSKTRIDDLIQTRLLHNSLKNRERKSVYNLVYGVLRHLNTLDWKIGKFYAGNYKKALNKLRTMLRLSFFEIDYLDFIPAHATVNEYVSLAKSIIDKKSSGIVNGVCRTYLRQRNRYNPAKSFKSVPSRLSVQYSFPEWMITGWIGDWGEQSTENLCRAFNDRPRFTLRINTQIIEEEKFLKLLREKNIDFAPAHFVKGAVKVTDVQSILKFKFFEKGYCAVQDESALLAVYLLMPQAGDRILDACAAPGGKLTAILQMTECSAQVTGLDPDWKRIKVIQQNCIQQHLTPCLLVLGEAQNAPFQIKFDKILVDAPCSGTGTIRKNPDIKWRRTPEEIEEFHTTQVKILEGVSNLVKPQGTIVYSTCSIQRRENEDVVENFLKNHSHSFRILKPSEEFSDFIFNDYFIRTFPHRHDMDGTFAVIFQCIEEDAR